MYYIQLNYSHFETGLITGSNKQFRLFKLKQFFLSDLFLIYILFFAWAAKLGQFHILQEQRCVAWLISATQSVLVLHEDKKRATRTIMDNKYVRKIADRPHFTIKVYMKKVQGPNHVITLNVYLYV